LDIYSGIAVLDENGRAEVEMPAWFQALNCDFRYQLTAIGLAMPDLHIAREITANRFGIAGGKPGAKVSWQVTGVRQDAYARANPVAVEEEKPEHERGLFMHPELYGQLESKSTDPVRRLERMKALGETYSADEPKSDQLDRTSDPSDGGIEPPGAAGSDQP
jgi:hypothetical protein